jgi:hypothetical protein
MMETDAVGGRGTHGDAVNHVSAQVASQHVLVALGLKPEDGIEAEFVPGCLDVESASNGCGELHEFLHEHPAKPSSPKLVQDKHSCDFDVLAAPRGPSSANNAALLPVTRNDDLRIVGIVGVVGVPAGARPERECGGAVTARGCPGRVTVRLSAPPDAWRGR